jgi:hypothetical protein
MNNRYNELTETQQKLFDRMINSVASHKNDFADELTKRTWWSFRQTEGQLWEDVQDTEDAKAGA